jgi:hypothetical protein
LNMWFRAKKPLHKCVVFVANEIVSFIHRHSHMLL